MTLRRAAFALASFTLLASPALAANEPPVVQAIFRSWNLQYNMTPSYKSLTTDGDTVTIEGVEASAPASDAGAGLKLAIGKIALKSVADQGNGIFAIGSATYSDLKLDLSNGNEGLSISIPETTSESWYVKAPGVNPTPQDTFRASMNVARKTTSGPITLTANGQSVTADGYQMSWDGDVQSGAGKSTFKISHIAVPESVVAIIDPSRTLKELGYTDLSFDLGGEGRFDVASDKLGFDFDLFYAAKDMGTLKLGAAAGEIPMTLIAALEKHETANLNALMSLAQGIQLNRFLFRFEDQSITKRILPLAAKIQGMDVQTLIASAAATVQLALSQLKNQSFTQQAVAAVAAFLNDPHSFTIEAKPAQPVSVMQVMQLDPGNPGAAIDRLGVSVKANN